MTASKRKPTSKRKTAPAGTGQTRPAARRGAEPAYVDPVRASGLCPAERPSVDPDYRREPTLQDQRDAMREPLGGPFRPNGGIAANAATEAVDQVFAQQRVQQILANVAQVTEDAAVITGLVRNLVEQFVPKAS